MIIKKYVARTIKEGIALVRSELGSDAIILSTKEIKGENSEKLIEILAAKDIEKKVQEYPDIPETNREINIEKEIKEIKKDLRNIVDFLRGSESTLEGSPIIRELLSYGIKKEIAYKISREIEKKIEKEDLKESRYIKEKIKEEIITKIKTSAIKLDKKPIVVALVGPTGVGKTTTIAKLASNFVVFDKLRTSVITIDTYRLAAVEQLKIFAKIVNIPVEVVVSAEEFPEAVEKRKNMDVIFIDTAGRSQKDEKSLKEIANFFAIKRPDEVHLVLSTTTKLEDLYDIVEKFKILFPNKLVFTKLDETNNFSCILEIAIKTNIPISYLTNGQSIPDAIERADPQKIVEYIMYGRPNN